MEKIRSIKSMQLDDIARELGLSTSTISRVISGKGKISDATRKRVKQYIDQHNYRPNSIARSLATRKTNSIGVIIPGDAFLHITPFFSVCLMGICEMAVKMDYDVVVTSTTEADTAYLQRLVQKKAVDGVIIMRTLTNDASVEYLLDQKIPFITIGSLDNDDVAQVDALHMQAACEITEYLIDKNQSSVGIIIGGMDYVVNSNRYRGFLQAHENRGIAPSQHLIQVDKISQTQIFEAIDNLIGKTNAIICGDDNICLATLKRITEKGLSVPQDVRVASLYSSAMLSSFSDHVTMVEVDDTSLGRVAVANLIDMIEHNAEPKKSTLGYSITYQ